MAQLTKEANRAGRAILQWSVRKQAEETGVAFSTIHRFEKTGVASPSTVEKIVSTFAKNKVEITNGEGTGARLLF